MWTPCKPEDIEAAIRADAAATGKDGPCWDVAFCMDDPRDEIAGAVIDYAERRALVWTKDYADTALDLMASVSGGAVQ